MRDNPMLGRSDPKVTEYAPVPDADPPAALSSAQRVALTIIERKKPGEPENEQK